MKRLNSGGIPRVVDIESAMPWLEVKHGTRTKWFDSHVDPIMRQSKALYALCLRGDDAAIAATALRVECVERLRKQFCVQDPLPVDELLKALYYELLMHGALPK